MAALWEAWNRKWVSVERPCGSNRLSVVCSLQDTEKNVPWKRPWNVWIEFLFKTLKPSNSLIEMDAKLPAVNSAVLCFFYFTAQTMLMCTKTNWLPALQEQQNNTDMCRCCCCVLLSLSWLDHWRYMKVNEASSLKKEVAEAPKTSEFYCLESRSRQSWLQKDFIWLFVKWAVNSYSLTNWFKMFTLSKSLMKLPYHFTLWIQVQENFNSWVPHRVNTACSSLKLKKKNYQKRKKKQTPSLAFSR